MRRLLGECLPLGPSRQWAAAWFALSLGVACTAERAGLSTASGSGEELLPNVVARVGGDTVEADFVVKAMKSRRGSADDVVRSLVREAVLAQHAKRSNPSRADYLARAALARRASELALAEARNQGEPTEAEVKEFTDRHWTELDRPKMSRASHALFTVDEKTNLSTAQAAARGLRAWLVERQKEGKLETAEQFRALASEFAAGTLKAKVEALQPVTEDGRVAVPGSPQKPGAERVSYVIAFAQAANALENVGDLSPPVETRFGVHVLYLEERFAPEHVPYPRRAQILLPEIIDQRAAKLQAAVLAAERKGTTIVVERAAIELMGLVSVQP